MQLLNYIEKHLVIDIPKNDDYFNKRTHQSNNKGHKQAIPKEKTKLDNKHKIIAEIHQ